LLLFGLFSALLVAWWKDRSALEKRLTMLEDRFNPQPLKGNAWGIEQVTGPSDIHRPGDSTLAWASLTADGQDEWMLLHYARSVRPTMIEVYENYMPGSISKVTAFDNNGVEHVVWTGVDPTPSTELSGVSRFPYTLKFSTNRIKLYLASSKTPGWNEIDAVALKHGWGSTLWVDSAEASSSWGARYSNSVQYGGAFSSPMGLSR
jgi:hypothetical protein